MGGSGVGAEKGRLDAGFDVVDKIGVVHHARVVADPEYFHLVGQGQELQYWNRQVW